MIPVSSGRRCFVYIFNNYWRQEGVFEALTLIFRDCLEARTNTVYPRVHEEHYLKN